MKSSNSAPLANQVVPFWFQHLANRVFQVILVLKLNLSE